MARLPAAQRCCPPSVKLLLPSCHPPPFPLLPCRHLPQASVWSLARSILELQLPAYFRGCRPSQAQARGLDPELLAFCAQLGQPGMTAQLPDSGVQLLGAELAHALGCMLQPDPVLRPTPWDLVGCLPLLNRPLEEMGQPQNRERLRRRLLDPTCGPVDVEVPEDSTADMPVLSPLVVDPAHLLALPEGGQVYAQMQLQYAHQSWGLAADAALAAGQQAQEVRGRCLAGWPPAACLPVQLSSSGTPAAPLSPAPADFPLPALSLGMHPQATAAFSDAQAELAAVRQQLADAEAASTALRQEAEQLRGDRDVVLHELHATSAVHAAALNKAAAIQQEVRCQAAGPLAGCTGLSHAACC